VIVLSRFVPNFLISAEFINVGNCLSPVCVSVVLTLISFPFCDTRFDRPD
jgi:hypothetical protein